MFKISKKVEFSREENKMSSIADIKKARKLYYSKKSKNLKFLLNKRFSWMNNFISNNHIGIEVGSGAGFTKDFIINKNLKLTDLGNDDHLDFKNIDAQSTGFNDESFNFVIASNMIHHIPYPIKFFKEMNRILKKNGRLIIFESYCSIIFQLVTMIMKHEGFDFTLNVWDEDNAKSDEYNAWHGNIAVPHLIFDDKEKFDENLGKYFNIEYEKLTECLIFLNSGGVTSKTKYISMNNFFLNILHYIDKILIKLLPGIFCMGRRIVLKKNN
ncbi:class I SAM-dependent methyltransferase [Pelagibacteraceae bacterium]|nr:class I SAM-dependent methyltransferase [Pelagibacteraceae bacterium]